MSNVKTKMHQIRFWYIAAREPLAGFKGPTYKGKEGTGRRVVEGKGKGGEGKGLMGEEGKE